MTRRSAGGASADVELLSLDLLESLVPPTWRPERHEHGCQPGAPYFVALREAIAREGMREPVVVAHARPLVPGGPAILRDADGTVWRFARPWTAIADGCHRLAVARALGLATVPTIAWTNRGVRRPSEALALVAHEPLEGLVGSPRLAATPHGGPEQWTPRLPPSRLPRATSTRS